MEQSPSRPTDRPTHDSCDRFWRLAMRRGDVGAKKKLKKNSNAFSGIITYFQIEYLLIL
jgi:hypothetical protein